MRTWSIDRRLFTGIGTLSLLLLVSGGTSIWAGSQMKQQLDRTTHETARALDLARQIERDAVVLDAEQRRLVLSGLGNDQDGLTHARQTMEITRQACTTLLGEMKTHLQAGRQQHLDDITTKLNAWEVSNARVIQLIAAGDASGAWDVTRKTSGPLLESVRATATSMAAQQEQAFAESVQVSEANYGFMRMLLIGMLLLSIPVAAAVGYSVRAITRTLRGVTMELGNGAQQLAAAAGQVAGASQALSQGASQQSASLEETSAAMIQMTSIARRNAEASHSVADMTAHATALIDATNGALGEMVVSMGAIKTSSDKVARIIKTIDEIAFQTNILALNAAVEAARAGAAGMGFAVVADEVRNLAQRSAQAASDTATLIEESIARASEGQHRVEQVSTSMTAVSGSATRIKALVDEVSSSSREQIRGIDQVTHAVSQMEKVTQSTAANAEENAAVGEELSAQAEAAMTAVRRLSRLIAADTSDDDHRDRRPASKSVVVPIRRQRIPLATEDDGDASADGTGTYGPF